MGINWPPEIGLFNPYCVGSNSFDMHFLSESGSKGVFAVDPKFHASGKHVAFRSHYDARVTQAHYLPRIVVRTLDGKRMPAARLTIYINGDEVLSGAIEEFLPNVWPIDCLNDLLDWKKPKSVFQAVARQGDEGDHSKQIGIMMPNGTTLEIQLSLIQAEEEVDLEFEALSALYTTTAPRKEAE